MIKEIIFDCFGVLTQDGWGAFLDKYARPDMLESLNGINQLSDKGIISHQELMKQISDITDVPEAIVRQMVATSLHPNNAVFELSKQLVGEYQLGIISNVGSSLDQYFPPHYLDIFTEKTYSFQEGVIKPAPEIFSIHLNRSGFMPDEVVFIDDRDSNCEGARAAGLHAIWFKDVRQLKAELENLGVAIQ